MIKKSVMLLFVLLVISGLLLSGCVYDPLEVDLYTLNVYPSVNNTYTLGDADHTWSGGWFSALYINGIPVGNVTAANNLTSDMIVRGDGGLKGIQTSIVSIDNFGNINTPNDLDAFDINAGNDVNVTNDLDVTDDADIGGDLYVGGNVTAEGISYTGTIWDDLRTPVNAVRVPGVKAPTWTSYRGGQVLAFADQAVSGNEEEVYFQVQLPHGYKQGTDLYLHPHYVYSVNQVNTRVRWGLEYSWANFDAVFPGSAIIYANGILTSNDADFHRFSNFPLIDGTGKDISSMLICRLFRNSSDVSDNFTNVVYLLEVDAHYLVDTPGSSGEWVK